jgi:hypothetical protein
VDGNRRKMRGLDQDLYIQCLGLNSQNTSRHDSNLSG